jgi:pimeloyl-ACP methyl ester carboxylesterase
VARRGAARGADRRGVATPAATPATAATTPATTPPGRLLGPEVPAPTATAPGVMEGYWQWNACPTGTPARIRYQHAAAAAAGGGEVDGCASSTTSSTPTTTPTPTRPPALLLIHGFGGNADHWRWNTPALAAAGCDVWAVDLLGYGFSDKPPPRGGTENKQKQNSLYCFETWARQCLDFAASVIGPDRPVFLITNSVGGLVGLQAALDAPAGRVAGVQLMNVTLRALHVTKQPPLARPLIAGLQWALRETPLGGLFFGQVATPKGVENVLRQCYANGARVTPELVSAILAPAAADPAAALPVFLDFISYSSGPLPEELLRDVGRDRPGVPVSILWGKSDPWEKVEWGRALGAAGAYPAVEEYVEVDAGHCPMDEVPEVVNPLVTRFVRRHAGDGSG